MKSLPTSCYEYCPGCDRRGAYEREWYKTHPHESYLAATVDEAEGWRVMVWCLGCRNTPEASGRWYDMTDVLRAVGDPPIGDRMIRVWAFDDAPAILQLLSSHSGDEDWIALVPPDYGLPFWMEEGSRFGCCSVSELRLPSGHILAVGAHA